MYEAKHAFIRALKIYKQATRTSAFCFRSCLHSLVRVSCFHVLSRGLIILQGAKELPSYIFCMNIAFSLVEILLHFYIRV
jgi:hypothetical protein